VQNLCTWPDKCPTETLLNFTVHAFLQQATFRLLRTNHNTNHQYDYGGTNY